jgi:hypothetical protein
MGGERANQKPRGIARTERGGDDRGEIEAQPGQRRGVGDVVQ